MKMKHNWLQKIYLRNVEGVIVAKEMGTFGYGGVLSQFQQPAEFYKIRDNNGRIHKTLLDRATRNAKGGVPLDIGDKVTALIYRFAGVGEKHILDTKFIKWYEKVVNIQDLKMKMEKNLEKKLDNKIKFWKKTTKNLLLVALTTGVLTIGSGLYGLMIRKPEVSKSYDNALTSKSILKEKIKAFTKKPEIPYKNKEINDILSNFYNKDLNEKVVYLNKSIDNLEENVRIIEENSEFKEYRKNSSNAMNIMAGSAMLCMLSGIGSGLCYEKFEKYKEKLKFLDKKD